MTERKSKQPSSRRPPAKTPEAREHQLVSLATDLVERQLSEGTASSQVITHYLKLGSTREELEQDKLRRENELLKAKVENMEALGRIEERYEEALNAMRSYAGYDTQEDIDD